MGPLHVYIYTCLATIITAIEIPHYAYQEIEDKGVNQHKKPPIPIVKQSFEQSKEGYQYSYETGNGIHAEETGYIKNLGDKKHEILVQKGTITYHDEHGHPITLTYVADEKGFRPQGDHLPTPPPIPDEIVKSLEHNAEHAQYEQKEEYQLQQQQQQPDHQQQEYQQAYIQQGYQQQEQEEPQEYENSQDEVLQREYQQKVQQQIQKQLRSQQFHPHQQYYPQHQQQQQQYQPQEYKQG